MAYKGRRENTPSLLARRLRSVFIVRRERDREEREMDAFFQSRSQSHGGWTRNSFKNFGQIPLNVQNHMMLVYLTLCCVLAASAAGAYLHILMNIGGFLTMMGCFGSIMCLLSMPPYEEKKRFGLLMAASAFEGASIGPLIELAMEFDSRLIMLAPLKRFNSIFSRVVLLTESPFSLTETVSQRVLLMSNSWKLRQSKKPFGCMSLSFMVAQSRLPPNEPMF
ncbi:bax inhibitor 1-like [Zingiber officinale]|uniref:bax inhibitor 1-like n=1 Tax=Zingiber officinale TaxID=94328 RepID=UPI001C4CB001|nr:bax inhibitor 1-like [Zingiber officinale]XP_042399311.1 bax inhibitor 1-like [Zingiber officinale]XP_042399312.1 bax inhibitor 1-like [Zingiber officinale]